MAVFHFLAVIICLSLGVYGASVNDIIWYEEVPTTTIRWTNEAQEESAGVDDTKTLTAEAQAAVEKAKTQATTALRATEVAAIEALKAGLNPEAKAQQEIATMALGLLIEILHEAMDTQDRAMALGASESEDDEIVILRLALLDVSCEVLARAHKDAVQQGSKGEEENPRYKLAELMAGVEFAKNLLADLFSSNETII